MTGIALLDATIGVFFSLLVYSLAATTIHEAIANLLNLRGKKLRVGVYRLVSAELGAQVMGEAPIKALHGPGSLLGKDAGALGRLPSSIPSASFAKALLQTLAAEYRRLKDGKSPANVLLAELRTKVAAIAIDDGLRTRLAGYIAEADRAAGVLGSVGDALRRLGDRVDLLGLKAADAKKVMAIIDTVAKGAESASTSVPDTLQSVQDALRGSDLDAEVKALLNGVIDHVQQSVDRAVAELARTAETLETELAQRFDAAMDRVIGWYVRQTKLILFVIGFGLAVLTNFNVIGYAGALVKNQDLRAEMVARAEVITSAAAVTTAGAVPGNAEDTVKQLVANSSEAIDQINHKLGTGTFQLGWQCNQGALCKCVTDKFTPLGLLSWLLIAFACTMGGQFWFDALKKLLAARNAVSAPPPAKCGTAQPAAS